MFTLFLTSSPCDGINGEVFRKNGFRDELLNSVPVGARGLFVASDPDNHSGSEWDSDSMRKALEMVGLQFSAWNLLDGRTRNEAGMLVKTSDFIVLAGGHVPTQKRFFDSIFLREELRTYEGVLMTISAGSMNSADTVYSMPEYENEVDDPEYQRFFMGLGLTSVQIMPHYYLWKDVVMAGKKYFREIAGPDSIGRRFYVFPDGTYMFSKYGYEEIRGECFLLENNVFRKVCEDGQKVLLPII